MSAYRLTVSLSDSEDDTGFGAEELGTFTQLPDAKAQAEWHLAESFASRAPFVWRKRGSKWTASQLDGEVNYTIEVTQ